MEEEIKQYLQFNVSPEISPVALWECVKAYLRGRIIAFASAKKKLNEAHRVNLEIKINKLEYQHKAQQDPEVLKEIKDA